MLSLMVIDILCRVILWVIDISCYAVRLTRGHFNKCPYMTGVPSSQVHFNAKVHFGSQKMQFRHPDWCPLVTGFTISLVISLGNSVG